MQNDNKNNKSESDLNLNESSQSDFILDETDTDQKQDNKINYDKETNIVDPADVENYIMSNRECFPGIKLIYLKSKLLKMDKDKFERICLCDLKSPTIILLVSVFLGGLGIDRFMIGDIGMGILKLLTGGLCGIFWIYDIFTITERVKKINFESIKNLYLIFVVRIKIFFGNKKSAVKALLFFADDFFYFSCFSDTIAQVK